MKDEKLYLLSEKVDTKIDEQTKIIAESRLGSSTLILAATKKQAYLEIKSLILELI